MSGNDNSSSSDSQQQQTQNQNTLSAQRTFGTGGTSSAPANMQQMLEALQFARGAYTGQSGTINNAENNVQGWGDAAAGTAGTGSNYLNDVLNGKYLNSNPYLDAAYTQGANALENSSRSAWGGQDTIPGSSGVQQAALDNAEGNLATNVYGGNYTNERNLQTQAAGLIPGQVSAMLQPATTQLSAAYQPLTQYLSALSSVSPGQNLTTTKDLTNLGASTSTGTATGNSTQQSSGGGKGLNFL